MTDLKITDGNGGLLDMEQASKYLNIKKSSLYSYCMRREVPCIKIGKLNRFRKSDLDRWIADHMQEATNENRQGAS